MVGIKQKMITTLKIYIISLSFESLNVNIKIELSCEKNSVMVSAYCIDPDQPAQSAQANTALHIPSQVDRGIESLFLKQKINRRRKSVCPG